MNDKMNRMVEILAITALGVTCLAGAVWAGPPAPPVIADVPRTPLGGPEISIATAVGIAAYGLWKSRR